MDPPVRRRARGRGRRGRKAKDPDEYRQGRIPPATYDFWPQEPASETQEPVQVAHHSKRGTKTKNSSRRGTSPNFIQGAGSPYEYSSASFATLADAISASRKRNLVSQQQTTATMSDQHDQPSRKGLKESQDSENLRAAYKTFAAQNAQRSGFSQTSPAYPTFQTSEDPYSGHLGQPAPAAPNATRGLSILQGAQAAYLPGPSRASASHQQLHAANAAYYSEFPLPSQASKIAQGGLSTQSPYVAYLADMVKTTSPNEILLAAQAACGTQFSRPDPVAEAIQAATFIQDAHPAYLSGRAQATSTTEASQGIQAIQGAQDAYSNNPAQVYDTARTSLTINDALTHQAALRNQTGSPNQPAHTALSPYALALPYQTALARADRRAREARLASQFAHFAQLAQAPDGSQARSTSQAALGADPALTSQYAHPTQVSSTVQVSGTAQATQTMVTPTEVQEIRDSNRAPMAYPIRQAPIGPNEPGRTTPAKQTEVKTPRTYVELIAPRNRGRDSTPVSPYGIPAPGLRYMSGTEFRPSAAAAASSTPISTTKTASPVASENTIKAFTKHEDSTIQMRSGSGRASCAKYKHEFRVCGHEFSFGLQGTNCDHEDRDECMEESSVWDESVVHVSLCPDCVLAQQSAEIYQNAFSLGLEGGEEEEEDGGFPVFCFQDRGADGKRK